MTCHCNKGLEMPPGTDVDAAAWAAQLRQTMRLGEHPVSTRDAECAAARLPCEIPTARELCAECHIRLRPAAAALRGAHDHPRDFYRTLMRHDCLADARRILAHALPRRRALWWACLVAEDLVRHRTVPGLHAVLEQVVRFVIQPNDAHRRGAGEAGRRFPMNSLPASLAMAAFFSDGSVSLPHLPPVLPRPFVTGRLVGVTVYLASVIRSAAQYKMHLRQYLEIGEQVAAGQILWGGEPQADSRPQRYDHPHPPGGQMRHHAAYLISKTTTTSGDRTHGYASSD